MPHPLTRDLLADGPLQRAGAPFQLLEIRGPDAADFLQRLCSQDVVALGDAEVAPAAFLDGKGKLQATCLVFRLGGSLWLETQAAQAERLAALLERYHFTEKLTIERASGDCSEVVAADDGGADEARRDGDTIVVSVARRGIRFTRTHGGTAGGAGGRVGGEGAIRPLDDERAECLRMLAGFVRVGVETEPTTLALEADLDDHVSTTKGCYTGQEIVARIHTYGHVNRKLCLLLLAAGERISAPEPLHELEDRLAVGRVVRAVAVPGRSERLGVGYLPKDFQARGTRLALASGAAVEVIGYEPLPA